jgi:hypothetical protein
VEDDKDAVSGAADVELDHIRAECDGLLECLDGVFRRKALRAAVAGDECPDFFHGEIVSGAGGNVKGDLQMGA